MLPYCKRLIENTYSSYNKVGLKVASVLLNNFAMVVSSTLTSKV